MPASEYRNPRACYEAREAMTRARQQHGMFSPEAIEAAREADRLERMPDDNRGSANLQALFDWL